MSLFDECSIRNGFTLFQDNTILEFSSPEDDFKGETCENGYQCAEQRLDDHYDPSIPGRCEACQNDQLCKEGSIALRDFPDSNVCPDGYNCVNDKKLMCPEGTICSFNRRLNCTEAVENNFFREIFEGTYCREGTAYLEMCPTGSYCPNQQTKETCPSGSFCMRKSKEDWLDCSACEEGATELKAERSQFVLIILVISTICFVKLITWLGKNEYVPAAIANPFVKIEDWLCSLFGKKDARKIVPVDDKQIKEERALKISTITEQYSFKDIDADGKGYVTFDDLEGVLNLSPKKFYRLQYCLLLNTTDQLTEEEFIEYFPDALYRAEHMEPTLQDVQEIFLKLDQDNNKVIKGYELYRSYLLFFLEESEINDLYKKFRGLNYGLLFGKPFKGVSITEEQFLTNFAEFLDEVLAESNDQGTEIVFKDLNLTVITNTGEKKTIVNKVSGEVPAKAMTALMGGSGAGKTSLLNALCGRAYYGDVTGHIYINGHEGVMDQVKPLMGFVPQDDIVYAELTVFENFLYAGRFRLPPTTTEDAICDLAGDVVSYLGLNRVKDSIVGDVRRRGVSGGEKKRVNIGLELMARPKILFLDEPTSGLDASASSLVMHSLKLLNIKQKITVCAVIHQPRKFIYDQCDYLILLKAGGIMAYCGPTTEAQSYFERFGYELPMGENTADFVIDVVTGALAPKLKDDATGSKMNSGLLGQTADLGQEWLKYKGKVDVEDASTEQDSLVTDDEPPEEKDLPVPGQRKSFYQQFIIQMQRRLLVMKRNSDDEFTAFLSLLFGVFLIALISKKVEPVEPDPDTDDLNYVDGTLDFEQLYRTLIVPTSDTTVDAQNYTQTQLCNMYLYHDFVRDSVLNMVDYSSKANSKLNQFTLKMGLVVSIMVAIAAQKPITTKRMEFFREAGSEYNVLAFFLAVTTIFYFDITIKMTFISLVALFFRGTIASSWPFIFNMLTLTWSSAAWGIFYSTWASADNVVMLIGMHMVLGSFFSGNTDIMTLEDLQNSWLKNLISSFVSPPRYYAETYAVNEEQCLKELSGFASKVLYLFDYTNFDLLYLGGNDPNITLRSCGGWFYNTLPSILVTGCIIFLSGTMLHLTNRKQMIKLTMFKSYKNNKDNFRVMWSIVGACCIGLLSLTVWCIFAQRGTKDSDLDDEDIFCSLLYVPEEDCSQVYSDIKQSGFFDELFNDTASSDPNNAPDFCNQLNTTAFYDFKSVIDGTSLAYVRK